MKLLFVYPNAVFQNPPPVSLAIFFSLLKGIPDLEIRLFDTTFYDVEAQSSDKVKESHLQVRPFDFGRLGINLEKGNIFEDFEKLVASYQPDLIALSCNEITYSLGLALLKRVATSKALKLVGGVLATFAPADLLKESCIDMVCIGEGEGLMAEVVEKLTKGEEISGLKNLWIKKDGKIIKNPPRPLVDVNQIPIPDYDRFQEARYYRPMAGKIWRLFPIETSRGCPYGCSYCNSPSQKKLYSEYGYNNFFRKKTITRIREEIAHVVKNYKAEYIYFLSDTLLCMNDREFNEFCDMYSEFSLPFWCQNRPEMVTYDRMKRLKEIGCHRMSIGVEHGNEDFRAKILNKRVKNSVIVQAFEILDKVGIPVSINNIIGFPGESRAIAFDTILLNRQLKFDTSNAYAFAPFRGTALYDLCAEKGYIDPNASLQCVTKGSILNLPGFSKDEIDGLIKTFALYAKMPEKYLDQIKKAEKDSPEGERLFSELSEIYKKMFFENKGQKS